MASGNSILRNWRNDGRREAAVRVRGNQRSAYAADSTRIRLIVTSDCDVVSPSVEKNVDSGIILRGQASTSSAPEEWTATLRGCRCGSSHATWLAFEARLSFTGAACAFDGRDLAPIPRDLLRTSDCRMGSLYGRRTSCRRDWLASRSEAPRDRHSRHERLLIAPSAA